jgi:hypothetical protein
MERKLVIMYSIIAGAILIASSATIMYDQALAAVAISGQTKTGTNGLSYTRVSAEASGGHYHSTIADGFGFWTLNVDNSISYTVDASKFAYNRGRVTNVVGPQSGIAHNLALQTQYTIEFFIVADEEFRSLYGSSWQSTAKNKLYTAVGYFENQHNIKFKDQYYYTSWDSNDAVTDICDFVTEVTTDTGWNSGNRQGANVLWAISGQSLSGPTGCANIPSGSGGYPASVVDNVASDMAFVVMHELSHNYGLQHNTGTWWDIMNTGSYPNKNWRPSNDDWMQSKRNWY